jgi:hypothetical protein
MRLFSIIFCLSLVFSVGVANGENALADLVDAEVECYPRVDVRINDLKAGEEKKVQVVLNEVRPFFSGHWAPYHFGSSTPDTYYGYVIVNTQTVMRYAPADLKKLPNGGFTIKGQVIEHQEKLSDKDIVLFKQQISSNRADMTREQEEAIYAKFVHIHSAKILRETFLDCGSGSISPFEKPFEIGENIIPPKFVIQ